MPSQMRKSAGAIPKTRYSGQVRWNPQEREITHGLTQCVTALAFKTRIRLVDGRYLERVEIPCIPMKSS
jgi:hypothetical protein